MPYSSELSVSDELDKIGVNRNEALFDKSRSEFGLRINFHKEIGLELFYFLATAKKAKR